MTGDNETRCRYCRKAIKKVGLFWRNWYGMRSCPDRWFGLRFHKPGQWQPFGERYGDKAPQQVDGWLAEVLHIVWAMEMREHEGPLRKLTAGHATAALDAVPEHILRAARIDRSRPL